jgi:restriction system protein
MGRNRDKSLEKQKYAQTIRAYESSPFNRQAFGHAPNSVGYFAHMSHVRPARLIELFKRLGVSGLTPNHIISKDEWDTLYNYIQTLKTHKTEELYKDTNPIENRIAFVHEINAQLLKQLAKRPDLIYGLSPRKFEELVAKLLEEQGCSVNLTKRTRDGGYDIFGKFQSGPVNLTFLAECKRYAPDNKVGVEIVRGLYGITEIHKANLGLLITSSSFTKDAYEEKIRIGPRIDLKDYSDLCSWLSPHKVIG